MSPDMTQACVQGAVDSYCGEHDTHYPSDDPACPYCRIEELEAENEIRVAQITALRYELKHYGGWSDDSIDFLLASMKDKALREGGGE